MIILNGGANSSITIRLAQPTTMINRVFFDENRKALLQPGQNFCGHLF